MTSNRETPELKLYSNINAYLEERYVPLENAIQFAKMRVGSVPLFEECAVVIAEPDTYFSEHLFKLIDAQKLLDPDVYKKAGISRKLFSKIRSDRLYRPSKKTAISLAIALELDLNETNQLLEKAGYILSHSSRFDLIIEYFIVNQVFNIWEINEALYYYEEPLLQE